MFIQINFYILFEINNFNLTRLNLESNSLTAHTDARIHYISFHDFLSYGPNRILFRVSCG